MKVQKKDGQLENFDRNKILNGVIKSGATPEQAESITKQIEAWATDTAVVRTNEIRANLIELLRSINPRAATNFEAYKKTDGSEKTEEE